MNNNLVVKNPECTSRSKIKQGNLREKERQREVSRLWWYELTTLVSNRIAYHKFEHVRIKINKKIKRSQRKRPKAFVA